MLFDAAAAFGTDVSGTSSSAPDGEDHAESHPPDPSPPSRAEPLAPPPSGIRLLAKSGGRTYTTRVTVAAAKEKVESSSSSSTSRTEPSSTEGAFSTTSAIDPLKGLVVDARSGHPAAVRALLDAVAPTMLAVVRAVLGRGDRDVEDVLQDSLVGVVQGLSSFRGESSMMHFARSIALRRSLDQRRKRARRGHEVSLLQDGSHELAVSGADDPSSSGTVATLRATTQSPAASVVAQRRRDAFRCLLGSLRPEQAEAFAQRVLFGYSKEEIARETGVSIDTVKSRLRLAKNALRHRIQDDPTLLELAELDDDL